MTKISLDKARVVTARELAHGTSRILRELQEAGRPALVTKHGRYIAVIQPLADAEVEAISLRSLALEGLEDDDDAESVDVSEVRRRLDAQHRDTNSR
ncbi:hypothetical protein NC239_35465 [Streptomyces sp. G3]|uniref:hypothetical protein n=1 Tax=unclassified Streptomyces TaxID=2593676 RepID=UPI0020300E0F|nr:hypothetical protein [Streptomyces sp. G3]MCM1943499.1 hypothetical protein [Streptomyces sp. G3]